MKPDDKPTDPTNNYMPKLTDAQIDAVLKEMKAYLQYVRAESKRFFEAALPALEAAKRIDLGPYAQWTEPERLLFNVERAYREFRGESFDAPIDALSIFRGMYELRTKM